MGDFRTPPADPIIHVRMDIADRILIVDDDRLVSGLLVRLFEDQGYHCVTAGTAAEARTALDEQEIALVLTDVDLPGESGLDFASWVLSAFSRTAVVIMSGIGHGEIATGSFLKLGLDGFLIKPFALGEALDLVQRALAGRGPVPG